MGRLSTIEVRWSITLVIPPYESHPSACFLPQLNLAARKKEEPSLPLLIGSAVRAAHHAAVDHPRSSPCVGPISSRSLLFDGPACSPSHSDRLGPRRPVGGARGVHVTAHAGGRGEVRQNLEGRPRCEGRPTHWPAPARVWSEPCARASDRVSARSVRGRPTLTSVCRGVLRHFQCLNSVIINYQAPPQHCPSVHRNPSEPLR